MQFYKNIFTILMLLSSFNYAYSVIPTISIQKNESDTVCKCDCEIAFEYEVDGLNVKFTGKVDKGDFDTVKYEWHFGDKSNSKTDANVEHRYNETGIYDFTLKATFEKRDKVNGQDCKASKEFSGTVYVFDFD